MDGFRLSVAEVLKEHRAPLTSTHTSNEREPFLTCINGDGETFHRGDGEGSEQRADADVDEDVGPTKPRTGVHHENRTQQQHG